MAARLTGHAIYRQETCGYRKIQAELAILPQGKNIEIISGAIDGITVAHSLSQLSWIITWYNVKPESPCDALCGNKSIEYGAHTNGMNNEDKLRRGNQVAPKCCSLVSYFIPLLSPQFLRRWPRGFWVSGEACGGGRMAAKISMSRESSKSTLSLGKDIAR